MDAIRSTGLWVSTVVVAMSCALCWPSTELETGDHAANRNCFPSIEHRLAKLERHLEELDRRLETAAHTQCEGRSDAGKVARARLEQLRRDKAAMERRIAGAKVAVARERRARIVISADCLENPLAKGCM